MSSFFSHRNLICTLHLHSLCVCLHVWMCLNVCLINFQDINPPSSARISDMLKPVKPPFLPPPSFALDAPVHARRYGSNWRTHKSLVDDRTVVS